MTLVIENFNRQLGERLIHQNISFTLQIGDTLFIQGPSGVGKTLLLRSLAFLDPFESGVVSLDGKTPQEIGIPAWRARVSYLHQQRVDLPGTPTELYFQAQRFRSQRKRLRGDLPAIAAELGLEQSVLLQPWTELSGGQAQRCHLAIAIALAPSVLLLDEPTASLDPESARRVERVLKNCGATLLWVTHDPHQPARVGGRILNLPLGNLSAVQAPPQSPEKPLPGSLPRPSKRLQDSPGEATYFDHSLTSTK